MEPRINIKGEVNEESLLKRRGVIIRKIHEMEAELSLINEQLMNKSTNNGYPFSGTWTDKTIHLFKRAVKESGGKYLSLNDLVEMFLEFEPAFNDRKRMVSTSIGSVLTTNKNIFPKNEDRKYTLCLDELAEVV